MADRIVLISDDSDFFDYIKNKLELRKSDELYTFSFDSVPSQLHILKNSVFIINSENSNNKTLDLLKLLENSPAIVIAYNSDEVFLKKCYRAGAIDFITLLTSDSEFRARLLPALNLTGILEKNKFYRELLTKNSIIDKNNEVYTNYEEIIEKEIEEIKIYQKKAIFFAISPSDSTKLSISPNSIETALLNNIRKNDILMNYAPNKYFLILFDLDINSAEKLWTKISQKLNNKLYAGITVITNQKKEQLINEVLNKLHRSINYEKNIYRR